MSSLVGFTGSRALGTQYRSLVEQVVASVRSSGRGIAVGCASGADRFVREAYPQARVFRAEQFSGPQPARLVRRSAAMVRAVANSVQVHTIGTPGDALIIGFVTKPCPAGLVPSHKAAECFAGFGSGSWSTLALAAGLCISVDVYWCRPGAPVMPASWGQWVIPAGVGSARQPCFLSGLLRVQAMWGIE